MEKMKTKWGKMMDIVRRISIFNKAVRVGLMER